MITAEQLERITRFSGDGLPVTSLYLGVAIDPAARGALTTQAKSLLHEIRPLTEGESLSREARLSVRGDIEHIEAALAREPWSPGGLAFFASSGNRLFEEVTLPRPVRDRVMVDATAWVRPMLAVLDEFPRTCVVVVDSQSAWMWEFFQDEMREAQELHDPTVRKPDYGGWHGYEEHRVRNKAEELTKRHYKATTNALAHLFRAHPYDLLVLGGHQYEVASFVEHLPRELRDALAGTFTVDPASTATATIRAQVQQIVAAHGRARQQQRVADVLGKAAAGGLATVGLRNCLWAASVAAVQSLMVQDGVVAPGVVCDESGWLSDTGDTCAVCGQPARSSSDVLADLAVTVIDEGGTVEHINDVDELRDQVAVAALRFPLPPRPGAG